MSSLVIRLWSALTRPRTDKAPLSQDRGHRFLPRLDTLEVRLTPAFTASFNPQEHLLTIMGTVLGEVGVISRTPAGAILLNNNPTGATTRNTDTVRIFGKEGNDTVILNLSNGPFGPGFTNEPAIAEIEFSIDGGNHRDTLRIQGGAGPDRIDLGMRQGLPRMNWNGDGDVDVSPTSMEVFHLYGGRGNDWLNAAGSEVTGTPMSFPVEMFGEMGNDSVKGGSSKDRLFGGDGNDVLQGGSGDDCLYGNGGNDNLDGGAGRDSLWGDAGDDTLNGGTSGGASDGQCDEIHGGIGKDQFSWDLAVLLAEDERTVSDYNEGEDV